MFWPLVETMLWDAEIGGQLLMLKGGSYGHRVAFTPDGRWPTSLHDGTRKIYDATQLPEKP